MTEILHMRPGLSKEPLFRGEEQKFHEDNGLKNDHLANLARFKAGRQVDPLDYYAQFPKRWMAFLHASFRNPVEVAAFFSVTEKCADKWWEGIGGPHAGKLGYAVTTIDGAAQFLFAAE